MRPAMKTNLDLFRSDLDIGRHIDQIPEDMTRLGLGIPPHPPGQQPIQTGRDDQKSHVEVHLQTDRGRQRVQMKEPDGVRQRVLDQHPLGVAGDQALDRSARLIGQQDGRLIVPQVLNIKLAEGPAGQVDRLFMIPGCAVLPGGNVQFDRPPGGPRQPENLLEEGRRTAAEGDEADPQAVELDQGFIGRELGIEDEFAGNRAVGGLPKVDEPEHLPRLFALAQVGVGITEGPGRGVLGQEGQNTRLTAAAHGDEMAFHLRRFPIIGHRMKIEVERIAGREVPRYPLLPGGQKLQRRGVVEP